MSWFEGRPAAVAALAVVVALALTAPLHGGWLVDPAGSTLANAFHGTHAWAAHVVQVDLWGGAAASPTALGGFPVERGAAYIGWGFLAPVAAFGIKPIVGVNLAGWLGPALGAAAFVGLAVQVGRWRPVGLLAGAVLFALSPTTLGMVLSGQVEKAQAWVLPLLLAVWMWGARGAWWRLVVVFGVWLVGALTSPYLAMFAGLLVPWGMWVREERVRLAVGAGVALVALLVARAYLLGEGGVFAPAYDPDGFPPLWGETMPVADLDTLLLGEAAAVGDVALLHSRYLGLALAIGAIALGWKARSWVVALVGVLVALGPELGVDRHPLLIGGHAIPMPAVVFQWLDLPLAHGGQYYRGLVVAHLGLGLMLVASARRWVWLVLALGVADALRVVAPFGVPWPTWDLPTAAWRAWDRAPEGAVLHLPLNGSGRPPNNPIRLAGVSVHGRPVVDLPRMTSPPDELAEFITCVELHNGRDCSGELPGVAIVAVDPSDSRKELVESVRRVLGDPTDGHDGVTWWAVRE